MTTLRSAYRFACNWGQCALDIAFPWPVSAAEEPVAIERPLCRQCGYPYPGLEGQTEDFVCSHCAEQTWYFAWARAAYRTEGQVHEAIVGFKYREEFYQRARLVGWLMEAFDRHAGDDTWDAVVPVPLYHRRRRERGFNQARELADGLGAGRGIGVLDCLARDRETLSQTGLERRERQDNMKGAFRLKARFDVRGRNLLIVDDVFTTGATTNACARVLVEAGANRVAVLTVART